MGGRGGGAPAGRQAPAATVAVSPGLQSNVLTTVRNMSTVRRDVPVTAVRTAFVPSVTAQEVDQALNALDRSGKIHFVDGGSAIRLGRG